MNGTRRRILAAFAVAMLLAAAPSTALADHFRGGHLSWRLLPSPPNAPNTVEFHAVQSFRADSVTPIPVNPGDGDPGILGPTTTLFSGTDLAGDAYRIIEFTVTHTYMSAGRFTAYLGAGINEVYCCRLDSLVNAPGDDYRVATVVDLGNANSGSPSSTVPPFISVPRILQMPAGALNASVPLSITADPDGDPFDCVMASTAQSGIVTTATAPLPSNATITVTPGCVLEWDTTGTTATEKYAVQVLVNENHPGNLAAPVAIDFIVEIVAAECGDDIIDFGVEECDGPDDAACPGLCRPAGGPHECECPFCGDTIIDSPDEQCDGAAGGVFGPCPGECIASGMNACQCAVCGDDETTALIGEECDGADDGACPGACLVDCTCAVCGDNLAEGPETCDGTDDGACPGLCQLDCTCPVCGDDATEGAEQCDGTDDGACPGNCLIDCTCAVCGDDTAEGPEQCDGADDAACPGVCQPNCTCGTCGDDSVNQPGEQCDGSDDAACPGLCLPNGDPNECTCPVCGDDDVNQIGEQCDGSDDGACPGDCLPSCLCAVCGDDVASAPIEQCDGTDDAACPGECRLPGDPNQCQCPVCGDDDVNQGSEQCDGADDGACPGQCLSSCLCAVCGDNTAEAPVEQCDGSDDAACPGECGPPASANQCQCPVCGDDEVNQAGEQCDGSDDAACPGECRPSSSPNACLCPVCGDDEVNQASEECDGADVQCDGGLCNPDCTLPTCGNCALDAGEECDPPNGEICNNAVDDDQDGRVDCEDIDCSDKKCFHGTPSIDALIDDVDCALDVDCNDFCSHDPSTVCIDDATCDAASAGSVCVSGASCKRCPSTADANPPGHVTCGDTCEQVFGCGCMKRDPAIIRFSGSPERPDFFKAHGRFELQSPIDPTADGLTLLVKNEGGTVYEATLLENDLFERKGGTGRYQFTDRSAKELGGGIRGGLYKVSIRFKNVGGKSNLVFKIKAYGDFSAATEAAMMTQLVAGNDAAAVAASWTATSRGWILRDAGFLFR